MLRDMFKKTYTKIDMKYRAGEKESARTAEEDAPVIPAGLWKKCNKCGKPILNSPAPMSHTRIPTCVPAVWQHTISWRTCSLR